jgi:radical SAM superfamily enzyme YgiQ (UPF0313 family)
LKKRILLISPNLKGIQGGINRIQPSLALGYLAGALENAGFEAFIRDTALEGYENQVPYSGNTKMVLIGENEKEIKKAITDINPDFVGISVLFSNLAEHAHTLARIVKELNRDIPVILGGNHISNAASDYLYAMKNPGSNLGETIVDLEDSNIDYAMRGESEESFVDLIRVLSSGQSPENIKGLVYRKNGSFEVNPLPEPVDVSKLPFPARHRINMEKYFKIGLFHSSKSKSTRVLNVMTSRGCPEKCSFCTTPAMWGNRLRWRTAENVFEEIREGVEKYGIREVQFEDDTLTANIDNLMKLCDLLEPLGIDWCTPNGIKANYHLNRQNEMFKRMKESGCYQVTLACESGVQRVLDEIIGKRLDLSHIAPAIQNAKEAGLFVHTFWIVGFPGETREEMEKTIRFAASVEADSYSVAILTPLPGTPIYRHIMKHNLWWDEKTQKQDATYRNSQVKADGFESAAEFEEWVNRQNLYLNSLIEKRDPDRARAREEAVATSTKGMKFKQT